MKIHFTENKSIGTKVSPYGMVRVFVDNDYNYGYFVHEEDVFGLLTESQKKEYLAGTEARLDVTPEVAQKIIDMGVTPYAKPKVC